MEQVRRDLIADAINHYAAFLQQDSPEPELRFETSAAYDQYGQMHKMLGDDTKPTSLSAGR